MRWQLCFVLTLSMWDQKETSVGSEGPKRLTDYKTPLGETLRQPRVWLSALLFFLYVGAEVSLGTWTYSLLTESRGIRSDCSGVVGGQLLGDLYHWSGVSGSVCQTGGSQSPGAGRPGGGYAGRSFTCLESVSGAQIWWQWH